MAGHGQVVSLYQHPSPDLIEGHGGVPSEPVHEGSGLAGVQVEDGAFEGQRFSRLEERFLAHFYFWRMYSQLDSPKHGRMRWDVTTIYAGVLDIWVRKLQPPVVTS